MATYMLLLSEEIMVGRKRHFSGQFKFDITSVIGPGFREEAKPGPLLVSCDYIGRCVRLWCIHTTQLQCTLHMFIRFVHEHYSKSLRSRELATLFSCMLIVYLVHQSVQLNCANVHHDVNVCIYHGWNYTTDTNVSTMLQKQPHNVPWK